MNRGVLRLADSDRARIALLRRRIAQLREQIIDMELRKIALPYKAVIKCFATSVREDDTLLQSDERLAKTFRSRCGIAKCSARGWVYC